MRQKTTIDFSGALADQGRQEIKNSDQESSLIRSYPSDGLLEVDNDLGGSFLKVDNVIPCSTTLRYAVHLRFLCHRSKKCSKSTRKIKSNTVSAPDGELIDTKDERRFYLYNDLRVVFPQRHSDLDQGKVPNQ